MQNGILPDKLKIARVTPLFKICSNSDLGNYRPITALLCFSNVLQKIIYNCLYKHLNENEIFYKKQFGFQQKNSAKGVFLQLRDQVNNNFEKKNKINFRFFIDLSKAFATVDHKIWIYFLKKYSVRVKLI